MGYLNCIWATVHPAVEKCSLVNKNGLGIFVGGIVLGSLLTYSIYYKNEPKNSVEVEFRDHLIKSGQVCEKCGSYNRNIMKKADLTCWKCDTLLVYNEAHPADTVAEPSEEISGEDPDSL